MGEPAKVFRSEFRRGDQEEQSRWRGHNSPGGIYEATSK